MTLVPYVVFSAPVLLRVPATCIAPSAPTASLVPTTLAFGQHLSVDRVMAPQDVFKSYASIRHLAIGPARLRAEPAYRGRTISLPLPQVERFILPSLGGIGSAFWPLCVQSHQAAYVPASWHGDRA